jgi:hypothetical protein
MVNISLPAVWISLAAAIVMPDLTPCFGAALLLWTAGAELLKKRALPALLHIRRLPHFSPR